MNKKTRKLFTWCLVVAMLITQMLFANVAFAATPYAGADRYATAIQVVKAGWTTSDNAVIAQGEDLADALAAAPLAYAKGKAPILLTDPKVLSAGVMDELTSLGVKNVYIVGGEGAVSKAIYDALAAKFTVKRLGGSDRAATSYLVAQEAFPTAPAKAVLVNGYAYADALSVSSIAASNGMPILLADKDSKSADITTYLTGKTVYAVGGSGVLSSANIGTATRLSGDDRYATNVAVLKAFTLDYSKVFVAVGEDANNVDALGGAALAAKGNNPMVLVNSSLSTGAADLLKANMTKDSAVYTLGGAVPASVATAVEACKPVNQTLKVDSVSAVDATELKVVFNKEVDWHTAQNVANYTLSVTNAGSSVGTTILNTSTSSPTLLDDGKTVLLPLSGALANGYQYKVSVAGVLDTAYAVMDAYTDAYKVFVDTAAPQLLSAEYNGSVVELTFNEHVTTTGLTTVKIDGIVGTVGTPSALPGDYTLDVTPSTTINPGTHSVVLYNIKDTVGGSANALSMANTSFTTTAVTTAPVVSALTPYKFNKFKVQFSQPLTGLTTANFVVTKGAHTYPGTEYTVGLDSTDTSNKTYVVTMLDTDPNNPLYASSESAINLAVTVKNFSNSAGYYGSTYNGAVTLTWDTVAPYVLTSNLNSTYSTTDLLVKFSESLASGSVVQSRVSVKGDDNIFATVSSVSVDGTDPTLLHVNIGTLASKVYTVSFQAGAVEDLAGNDNTACSTTVDNSAATGTIVPAATSSNSIANVITINYGANAMGASAVDLANYTLDGIALPAGSVIGFTANSSASSVVTITLPVSVVTVDTTSLFGISTNVKNSAGTSIARNSDKTAYTTLLALKDNTAPLLASAQFVLANSSDVTTSTIKLTFNEKVVTNAGSTGLDDFAIYINGVKTAISSITATGATGATTVNVTTATPFNINQPITVKVIVPGSTSSNAAMTTTDVNGNYLTSGTEVTVTR